jgi:hypothetical protein
MNEQELKPCPKCGCSHPYKIREIDVDARREGKDHAVEPWFSAGRVFCPKCEWTEPHEFWNTRTDTELQAHNRVLVEALTKDTLRYSQSGDRYIMVPEDNAIKALSSSPIELYRKEQEVIKVVEKLSVKNAGSAGWLFWEQELKIKLANLQQARQKLEQHLQDNEGGE